jgi:hypothetical protein
MRVLFQGVKQESSAIPDFKKSRPAEPDSISAPGSGWRFGLVAVDTVRDVSGRRASSPASGRRGAVLPGGVFFIRP